MNFFVEYLAELGADAFKKILIEKKRDGELKEALRNYIEKQKNINEMCTLTEEIDFQRLAEYMSSELLEDVQIYLFGDKPGRESAENSILSKAYSYSNADDRVRRDRVGKLVNGSLEILYNFYRDRVGKKDWFVAAEIVDTITKDQEENRDKILDEMKSGVRQILDKMDKKEPFKIAQNMLNQKLHRFVMENYIKERYRGQELSEQDVEAYSDLFKLCIDVLDNEKKVEVNKNIFEFVRKDILTKDKQNLIKVVGPDGTGKSTFLSILYIYLYSHCLKNGFTFYPFYINLHFYDAVVHGTAQNEQEVRDRMYGDLETLKQLVRLYPDIPYIIIIDGNENYFRTTLKSAGYFNDFIREIAVHKKIVCIAEKANVRTYRERKQEPYMYSRMLYTFRFKSIKRYEKETWEKLINHFAVVEGNDSLLKDIREYLEKFDLDEVDLNILNVFKDCYDSDVLKGLNSISDLYKNYCMAYLKDRDDFEDCARMSYKYFMTNKKFSQDEIANNSRKWNLIHQHKTISNFLIAYYFVNKIKNYGGGDEGKQLEYLFPKEINIFIKPLINEDLETQELVFDNCKQIYEEGGILAKSQVLYMMGRIVHKSLRADILSVLEGYYNNIHEKIVGKKVEQTEEKERDLQLMLRSAIISLVYLGKKDKREEYLKMLLNYPIANQINRGFHLEYYGDMPRKPSNKMYNYSDDGTGDIDNTYNMLLDRTKHYLSSANGTEDLNFQINLFTLCSLIQVRLGKNSLPRAYIENLKDIIHDTLQKEKNNINIDFKAYLTMLEEDIRENTYNPYSLYEKLNSIKDIERRGWVQEIKNDVVKKPYENVVEHIYYTWVLGMVYLPEEPPKEADYEYYDKRKILDAVLIHDWGEIDVGDAVPKEDTEQRREKEDFRMRVLLMHDTYNDIGNMLQYKKAWNVYKKDTPDINGKIAYELDKIQALYQFYVYKSLGAEFTEEKDLDWRNEKSKITTSLGKKILKAVVQERFEKN